MPVYLPLHARGGELKGFAILDDEDCAQAAYRWCLNAGGYAVRKVGGKVEYLHRIIAGVRGSITVDHRNRDKLDNRRANLRLAPQSSQPQNTSAHRDGSSRFRGVSRRRGSWRAQVKSLYLGSYEIEEDAAAVAARYRAKHLPFSVEDPDLLARPVDEYRAAA